MINDEETAKIARLSRLALTGDEIHQFAKDLSEILDYAQKLNELDVSGIDPLSHVQTSTNVFREDQVQTSLKTEDGLRNARQREGAYIQVPIIIE